MTSPVSEASNNLSGDRRILPGRVASRSTWRSAFTITELLVVIGIIVVLVAIVTIVVGKSRRSAMNLRVKADFQAITMALEAFKQDHREYPGIARIPAVPGQNPGGANDSFNVWKHNALGLCLMSPGAAGTFGATEPMRDTATGFYFDGAGGSTSDATIPGQGFRAVNAGKIWQPYLSTDKFKVVRGAGLDGSIGSSDDTMDILDAFGGPIQYYPRRNRAGASLVAPMTTPPPDPATNFVFDGRDGAGAAAIPGPPPRVAGTDPMEIQMLLGESDLQGNTINNLIDGQETVAFDGPYLLISWGPDMLPLDLTGLGNGQRRKQFDARDRMIDADGDGKYDEMNDNVYNDE